MPYIGNYTEDYATLNYKFTTRDATGLPTNPVDLAVKVYTGSATGSEVNTGVTLAATGNFDGIAGLNNLLIDLSSAAFYAVGADYAVVVTAGTVDGISIIGEVICTFSIENRFDEADLTKIHGTALTETATQLAGAFTKFFDVASPVFTCASINQTGDCYPSVATAAAYAIVNSGMGFRGTVTAAEAGVSFTIGALAGLGAGAFVDVTAPWYAYVFRDNGGGSAAPQGEIRKVTGYTTGTGLFTTSAFSASVATGDDVIIINPRLADIVGIREKTDYLPSITAGSAGGLFIAGTNAQTTITTSLITGAITLTTPIQANLAGIKTTALPAEAVAGQDAAGFAKFFDVTTPVGTVNLIQSDLTYIHGSALTETSSGYLSAAFKKLFDVATPVFTSASVNQTGDGYARLGAPAGASVSVDIAALQASADILTGGGGATSDTIIVTDEHDTLLDGADVWITSDLAGVDTGTKVAGSKYTNSSGEVTFQLDDGDYWLHCQMSGFDFTTTYPKKLTVSGGAFAWA